VRSALIGEIAAARPAGMMAAKNGESFAIAGLGFVLSTGFWLAFGDVVSALRRRFRARAAKRLT